jgi:hypothetical protein
MHDVFEKYRTLFYVSGCLAPKETPLLPQTWKNWSRCFRSRRKLKEMNYVINFSLAKAEQVPTALFVSFRRYYSHVSQLECHNYKKINRY